MFRTASEHAALLSTHLAPFEMRRTGDVGEVSLEESLAKGALICQVAYYI
jgi:hypothetical protein